MDSSHGHRPNRRQFLKSAVLSGAGAAAAGIGVPPAAAGASQKPLVLVENGQSAYSILIAKQASPSEQRAASELQRFIAEMSGAHLPIVIDPLEPSGNLVLVGDSNALRKLCPNVPFDSFGAEGFTLQTVRNHLLIAGSKQRGTLYGVYTFLDQLGCRWFTADVSAIPKKPTLLIKPLNELHAPAFEYREPFFTEAADKDWAARNRVNGSFQQLDESTGGKVSYFPFVHSFYSILPPRQYFATHPEYYALVDGKRRGEDAQLCLTNPHVLGLTIDTVLRWIDEHPEASIFSVSQNDTQGWCECDNCQRVEREEGGAHSGPILRFVNAVAAEVLKTHPDKLIDTLAYWYSEPPPLQVRPLPNVRIRLCPIGACEGHPYSRCEYDRYFLEHLEGWATITNQLYIWHYVTNFAHYLMPFPDFDELASDIPMYKQHGVAGIFLEGDASPGGGGENAELRSYVMARLLWNPQVNLGETVNEFMAAYYGKAARAMRAYFDLQHRQVRPPPQGNGRHMWIYTPPGADYLSPDFLLQATKLLGEAATAAGDEATRRRVLKARLSIDYVKLMRAKAFSVREGWYAPERLDELKANFQTLVKDTRSFGIDCWHEGRRLEQDEADFASLVKPYRVAALESSTLRAFVAPELNGRIVSLIDKATNAGVLHHPDPGAHGYPNRGGLGVFVHSDYVAREPYDAVWELESQPGPQEVRLTGTCPNGLKLRRTIRLLADKPVVHTETTLVNAGSSPTEAVLCSQCEVALVRLAGSAIAFRNLKGKTVRQVVFEAGKEPEGSQWYSGPDQPDGAWTLAGAAAQLALVNRFPGDLVTRCSVNWTGKAEDRVVLTLWSARRILAPGESLKLEGDYEISRSRGA